MTVQDLSRHGGCRDALRSSAILSVADKTGIERIAGALAAQGVTLVSTGGTALHLRRHGFEVTDIAALTGHAPLLGGKVKALHPAVFAGLLAGDADEAELATHGFPRIDFLVGGIAPLGGEAADLSAMDIGGPAMIRAAVKAGRVTVATDPVDYADVVGELRRCVAVSPALRRSLAIRALRRLIDYDAQALALLERPGD
jgi:phosphoribosylaminoimidazolecarboxamide formyltransferase/IMP cyclohydrolase